MKKEMIKKCEDVGSSIENESYSTEVQELLGKRMTKKAKNSRFELLF